MSELASREAWAWIAGVFEGEGWVGSGRNARGTARNVTIRLNMADEDVVRRLQTLSGFGTVRGPYLAPGKKPMWTWGVFQFEHVQQVVAGMWPNLGQRRRQQITDALLLYHSTPRLHVMARKDRLCGAEGCSRPMGRNGYLGLCVMHYAREKRSRAAV